MVGGDFDKGRAQLKSVVEAKKNKKPRSKAT
jgi:hypothetical protein